MSAAPEEVCAITGRGQAMIPKSVRLALTM